MAGKKRALIMKIASENANKQKESRAAANSIFQKKSDPKGALGLADNRSGPAAGRLISAPNGPPGTSKFLRLCAPSPVSQVFSSHFPPHSTVSETIQCTVGGDLKPGDPVIVKELKRVAYIFSHIDGFGYTVSFQPDIKKKGPLYTYEMLDYKPDLTHKLEKVEDVAELPEVFIRINSFAFAKSKKMPIASHSFSTCLGIIIQDNKQQMGGMAHIDTDAQEEIADKTKLILASVHAMIKSIKPEHYGDLEMVLFAGLGLAGTDNFQEFVEGFMRAAVNAGIDGQQIHMMLSTKDSAKLAIYFPEQGKFYLENEYGKEQEMERQSTKRLTYDGDDYEDQEDIKDEIREGKSIIIEVEFNEEGKEIAYTKSKPNPFYPSDIMGVDPLSEHRETVQKKTDTSLQPAQFLSSPLKSSDRPLQRTIYDDEIGTLVWTSDFDNKHFAENPEEAARKGLARIRQSAFKDSGAKPDSNTVIIYDKELLFWMKETILKHGITGEFTFKARLSLDIGAQGITVIENAYFTVDVDDNHQIYHLSSVTGGTRTRHEMRSRSVKF